MTLYLKRFLVALCLVYFAVFSTAIYDPSATTTKPSERRESVLPRNLIQNKSRIQIEPRSLKWQQQSPDKSDTKNWSPWRKASSSEIEQRTQIDIENYDPRQIPEQISEKIPDQQHNLEFDNLQQRENLKPPVEYRDLIKFDKNYGNFENESKYGNRPHNEIDFQHKYPQSNEGTKEINEGFQNEDYEGVAIDSTKPRKENIVLSHKPRHKVARYDSRLGVQCPDHNSTGQFVYPPDCKFFVNCWQGRAFVQPCAPNTHFNPDTLECDFPHKVKCYENDFIDFKESLDSESQVNRKLQKLIEPKCPSYLIGLLPHYGDCTKFVQCAHGVTYIMNCNTGTVFNPTVGVCDWPRNVKGCEDTFKSDEDDKRMPLTSLNSNFGRDKSAYAEVKRIICPADFTGLLAHPETCKKFLQCANGVTYIMDCGPGTVFNPVTTVCDWPYNVKGCKDTLRSDKDDQRIPLTSLNSSSGRDKLAYTDVKRITCPAAFTGLLPHPETCKKFLQCANGATYIMDCGPGTVFNPVTTVCDWLYNVPSCKTDKSGDGIYRTGARTWSPSAEDRGITSWSNSGRYNHTTNTRNLNIFQSGYSTTMSPTYRSTWRPFTTTLSPRWIPMWTTARPFYNRSVTNYHNLNSPVREENRYKDRGSHNLEGKPSGNLGRPSGSNYDPQETESQRYDQESQGTHLPDHPEGPWLQAHTNPDYRYGYQYYPPGYHHHHHHHHYHNYGSTSNPSENTNWANAATTSDQQYNQGYYPSNTDSNWRPNYNYNHNSRHYDYHNFENAASDKTDQRQFQPPGRYNEDNIQFQDRHNGTKFDTDGNTPANRKPDYDFSSNTQNYDRTTPGLYHPSFNRTSSSVGNIFPNSDNISTENWDQTQDESRQDKLSPPWTGQENIAWNQSDRSNFKPSTWHGQENRGEVQTENQTHPWHQEEAPFPVYYIQPVQPLTHSKKSVRPTPISGQMIRLRGGSGPNDGYVEVQGTLPGWGIVCDSRNSWTLKEAHVLCRQLGYIRGAEMAWQGRNNRNGVPTWIAANTVTCLGNETRFQSCKFTHNEECRVARDAIGVRCVSNRIAHCRKDEIPHNGHCYHLAHPDNGLNHAEALEHCTRRDARLIDVTSQAENNFVSELLLQSYPEVNSIMTSGFGFTTMNRTLWLWADSARAKFKFTKWWPGWMNDTKQPPWVGYRPLCIVMKRKFPCYERPESTCDTDYFFWDTEDCATASQGHFFICKRPYDDIGCVYGKGNQYTGKANVTISGNACLSWADERIAHQLHVNVVNKEVRDKLKMHNYCRNPNPGKESRPWCFIVPGKYEYCDIPACGNIDPRRSMLTGQCKPKHFECMPGECIPSPWVCDGEEDCTNGADERRCILDLGLFQKSAKHKLEGYDVEKWLNTPLKTCALRCKEADFTCRSFNHKLDGNVCLLSNSNIGLTGALKPDKQFDYYEMRERSMNCNGMYICNNHKCINQTQVCDGKNDCDDRSDENICTAENLDYDIRLAGANNSYEGRIEVKILGHWGQVCDDGFGMINADVICKELGFDLGALEVRSGGFYGNLDPSTRFMVDQLKCRGNETTLRECDFNGWGIHNCQPEEAVGIVCKTAVNTCQEGHWKCDNSPTCIPTPFICDEVVDCPDRSDESPEHCDAPFELRLVNGSNSLQGRVEVRHHGVWGTVCDDDFTNATATVICRSLGYGGIAIAKKDGFFGPGQGPIWLDEVFCHGNESQLYRCEHNHWGQHNCDHNEDAGVICSPGNVNNAESYWINNPELPERNIDELLPANCGHRAKDFNDDDDLIFQKVVHGNVAPKGTYPWQASIRVRGHSRSSHWCGAVMISPLHLLTAAHCLEGYNKGTYFVRAGDYNTDIDEGTEAEANIEDYYVHEEFRKGHRMNNDIALILLKGHGIPLGKDIMPICLPPENTDYSPGLNCTISGFGSIETGKTTQSKDLRYGWVPLLDQSICRASYVYGEGAISEGMMCAGYLDEGIDTCDGDSGGPLACYHNGAFTLYGITSWGQHCGKANKPGVYVRVAYYRRWIDQKIKESLAGR
ncbi:uncharacterized protein [Polyergus mexicanus]|uniref:uncharacterized protein isoform X3 n=1 Tax=Polyergus mexicanus TaxID=615972 RepID=UPI0038B5A8FE